MNLLPSATGEASRAPPLSHQWNLTSSECCFFSPGVLMYTNQRIVDLWATPYRTLCFYNIWKLFLKDALFEMSYLRRVLGILLLLPVVVHRALFGWIWVTQRANEKCNWHHHPSPKDCQAETPGRSKPQTKTLCHCEMPPVGVKEACGRQQVCLLGWLPEGISQSDFIIEINLHY